MSEPPLIYVYYNGADLTNYRGALEAAGCVPVFATDPAVAKRCAALLLPGGGDIDPARYGQTPRGKPRLNPEREAAEFALLDTFLQAGKPILGICLGLQMINVALGGDLQQLVMHHGADKEGGDSLHPVRNAEGALMAELYGERCVVNSCHRQAVGRLGKDLEAIQWAEDGVVEAVLHRSLPILGVQWHPERIAGLLRRKECVDGGEVFRWLRRHIT